MKLYPIGLKSSGGMAVTDRAPVTNMAPEPYRGMAGGYRDTLTNMALLSLDHVFLSLDFDDVDADCEEAAKALMFVPVAEEMSTYTRGCIAVSNVNADIHVSIPVA